MRLQGSCGGAVALQPVLSGGALLQLGSFQRNFLDYTRVMVKVGADSRLTMFKHIFSMKMKPTHNMLITCMKPPQTMLSSCMKPQHTMPTSCMKPSQTLLNSCMKPPQAMLTSCMKPQHVMLISCL
jgi:hypothetical protein